MAARDEEGEKGEGGVRIADVSVVIGAVVQSGDKARRQGVGLHVVHADKRNLPCYCEAFCRV